MPLPVDFEADRWTAKIGRTIFPWLIWLAKNHRTVFYSELDAEIVRRRIHHHVNYVQYGHPAGAVGDGTFDAGGSLGDDSKDFVRCVRELERRIGVETTARPARVAHLSYQSIEKSFDRTIGSGFDSCLIRSWPTVLS